MNNKHIAGRLMALLFCAQKRACIFFDRVRRRTSRVY